MQHEKMTNSATRPQNGRGKSPAGAAPGREYWRVDRVARYLDVSRKRVYQLVQDRRLTAIRLGPRQMRIERASLESYIQHLHARFDEDQFA